MPAPVTDPGGSAAARGRCLDATTSGRPAALCSPPSAAGRSGHHTFLLICPEWFSTGGISRYNRSLAMALAAAGHRIICLVRKAMPDEHRDAISQGVTLVEAVVTPAGPEPYIPVEEVVNSRPTVVIGHDRRTGPMAWTYARKYLSNPRLVHIVHTAYSQNEPYKCPADATSRIQQYEQEMRRTAADADVIGAVGPLLARRAEAVIGNTFDGMQVVRLDPGIDVAADLGCHRSIPANRTVMMLTRSAHIEQKGLDLAALAVPGVRTRPGELAPELLIRGAPFDGCDALRAELQRCSGLSGDRIDVRPFTTDSDEINRDVFRAALYLLPSRVEGFGLAALEAIARGTPVLVSSKSGLAEALREHLGLDAGPIIVDVHGDARDVPTWRDAIARAMWDLPGRFEHADKIRHSLSRTMRWDDTVATLLAAVEQPAGDGCGDVAPPSIKGAR